MEVGKIITVANQKGGTGKTTTVRNLGEALAKSGHRVLLVDFDPQANLSMSCGVETPDELHTAMDHIMGLMMDDDMLPAPADYIMSCGNVDLIPANIDLSVTEINLRDEMGGERTLSGLLEPLRSVYDYIIIDTNSYLGLLTINALAACDSVVIPVSPQLWSATGLRDLLQTIAKVKRKINPRIEVDGILLTMCDIRTRLYRETKSLLDDFCAGQIPIYHALIPYTVRVGEANYNGTSILEHDHDSKASCAYTFFAQEVVHCGSHGH